MDLQYILTFHLDILLGFINLDEILEIKREEEILHFLIL